MERRLEEASRNLQKQHSVAEAAAQKAAAKKEALETSVEGLQETERGQAEEITRLQGMLERLEGDDRNEPIFQSASSP